MNIDLKNLAQKSKTAIETLHITMMHLFVRGEYKPMGVSGETLKNALLDLSPEIYGSIANPKKMEINGLIYVLERLPLGIESCRYINLTAEEGLQSGHFPKYVPAKRKRNCFRVDQDQFNIEITRGKSDVYDLLTHLTFMYIESHKLLPKIFIDKKKDISHEWLKLEDIIINQKEINQEEREILFVYCTNWMGRSFEEVKDFYQKVALPENPDRCFSLIYWLGKLSIDEYINENYRLIRFSDLLIEQVGMHVYGNQWANKIKTYLYENQLIHQPIHIISANMHSVMNVIYAAKALPEIKLESFELYELLSNEDQKELRTQVYNFAKNNGLESIPAMSGANIDVQIINLNKAPADLLQKQATENVESLPILLVMDYAFGEQAFEVMDELLKPYEHHQTKTCLNIQSISIMGKAGILNGNKGDILIPTAHILEGSADNYFFYNELHESLFKNLNLGVHSGNMITVLGTSLQNQYILNYFKNSSWNAIGLEMEGAHYQKAIQIASKIRNHINSNIKVRYAYYASDNPLETGSTLASGGLGLKGVVPTYAITEQILKQLLTGK